MKTDANPLSLFISYAHEDDELRAMLNTHLALLKRQGVFDVWHDRRIAAGQEWAGEIDAELEGADVVLLLVSADFLASDYCYDREMRRALQRHDSGTAEVVPVILRPCDWQTSPFGRLQAVPRDGKPVRSYADIDVAFTEVAQALRAVADRMRGNRPSPPQTQAISSPSLDESIGVHVSPPSVAPTAEPSHPSGPIPASKPLLKIGAIKVLGIEIGPFELIWPPQFGVRGIIKLAVVCSVIVALLGGLAWGFIARPQIERARDFMRRGDYSNAVSTLDAAPSWMRALPPAVALAEQARFGAKLANGTPIRAETPALATLSERYPADPDVLVFRGLKAFYVDEAPEQALNLFTQAAQADPIHAEAHFLATGEHLNLAYAAIGAGDTARARLHVNKAQEMARVLARTRAADLPRYANQAAELQEIEGRWPEAFKIYARLASGHPLSALQATFVSWRMSVTGVEQEQALEQLGAAIKALEETPKGSVAQTAWIFQVSVTKGISVGAREDQLCLMGWGVEISKSLHGSAPDASAAGQSASDANPRVSPERCKDATMPDSMRDIVCVQALTAQQALMATDSSYAGLAKWIESPLRCRVELEALPNLASSVAGPTT